MKYVTLAESDLRNRSLSHAGAVGTWQFMGPTAQRFHLLVTPAVDERQDFSPSTDAALDYLKGLRQQLGSWALALAAYNCGENRVQKEKDLQRVDNYYHLALPEETERYVYRIIAAKIVVESPQTYGFDIPPDGLYEPLEYDEAEAILTQEIRSRSPGRSLRHLLQVFQGGAQPLDQGVLAAVPGPTGSSFPKARPPAFAEAQRFGRLEPKIETPPPPGKPKQ